MNNKKVERILRDVMCQVAGDVKTSLNAMSFRKRLKFAIKLIFKRA